MANAVDWEVWGTFRGESFTASSGQISKSITDLAKQVGVNWLHVVAPMIRDEAQRLCPRGDTGLLWQTIRARYNDAEGYAEIGSNSPAAKGRVYLLYVECGTSKMRARHPLASALSNVMGNS